MKCTCEDCGWSGEDPPPVQDVWERLDTCLGIIPQGQCPECGMMVYDPADEAEWDAQRKKNQHYDQLVVACEGLLGIVEDIERSSGAAWPAAAFARSQIQKAKEAEGEN